MYQFINNVRLNAILLSVSILSLLICGIGYCSELIIHQLESPAIVKNMMGISSLRQVEVYIPDGYNDSNLRYPVLYWIPGFEDPAYGIGYKASLDNAIKTGKIPPAIIVFIDVQDGTWFLNSPVFGNWEDFLVSELIPFIDNTYRTIPDKMHRGLMGISSGGYSALVLSIRHPDTWGAIGANDPAVYSMWLMLRDEADFPQAYKPYYNLVRLIIQNLPPNFDGYANLDWRAKAVIQLATAFSPNPNKPLFCDFPFSSDGKWIPEVREIHSKYDLTNPKTIADNYEILQNLLSIVIVVPEVVNPEENNRILNIELIEILNKQGIEVTRIDSPGGHISLLVERFMSITEELLKSIMLNETSVSLTNKKISLWGQIKEMQ